MTPKISKNPKSQKKYYKMKVIKYNFLDSEQQKSSKTSQKKELKMTPAYIKWEKTKKSK